MKYKYSCVLYVYHQVAGRKKKAEVESGIVQILAEYIAHHAETAKEIRKLEATVDMTISCSKVGDLNRVLVNSCGCQS